MHLRLRDLLFLEEFEQSRMTQTENCSDFLR
jgi:hypothetical protein